MGHRGYTNRAKSGDRALVARQRQRAARAALIKQRERSRRKNDRPKAEIVIEPCEPQASDEKDRSEDEGAS
jgi:hypothetical protein